MPLMAAEVGESSGCWEQNQEACPIQWPLSETFCGEGSAMLGGARLGVL